MPAWIGTFRNRTPINQFKQKGTGLIAGLARTEHGRWVLSDESDSIELEINLPTDGPAYWLAIRFEGDDSCVVFQQPALGHSNTEALASRRPFHRQRAKIIDAMRHWFLQQGFLEVTTPVRVETPAIEPYLDALPSRDQWLRTSPELHMKRLLAAGPEPLFQFAPSFRDEPNSKLHRSEFTMLEWYRPFADLEHLIDDVSGLLQAIAPFSENPTWFSAKVDVKTVQGIFLETCGLVLDERIDTLAAYCAQKHIHTHESDTWDDLFFRILLTQIEPNLGGERPLILRDYPASQAALAKVALPGAGLHTCYRFELYGMGVELANAFYEVTDPQEQLERIRQSTAERAALGKETFPLDTSFLQALQAGLPPCAGIALGVDRLVMLALGQSDLAQHLHFP